MKAAPALWLLLSTAGAKLTDDRCDPTRERDDRACRAILPNGEHSHGNCCAVVGTGYCSDGFSYKSDPAWACGPGAYGVTGCCYAPGSTKARYMDEYDVLSLLIILYLVFSATLGILGCVWTQRRGHCSGQVTDDAPDAVPLSDIEATTIANPLLPDATPSAPPTPEPSPTPSAPPWEPMFGDNETYTYATPAFLAPTDDNEGAPPEGVSAEAGKGVGKPAADAPPAYVEQPALVPEAAESVAEEPTAEAVAERIEPGDGCCKGCLASPHLKCLVLTCAILFQLLPLPFCNATWLYQGECDEYWTMRNYAGKEEARDYMLLILVMCYLFECILSHTQTFLVSLKRNRESLKAHIDQVKHSRPVITMRIQCYHHETRRWRDKEGRHHSKQVRVNTHAASHVYHYSWVRDCGGDAYEHWPATLLAKVEFGKKWVFGDDYTRQHFAWYKRRFMRHNRRDRHYDYHEEFTLPEFREHLLVEMYPGAKPELASTGWYWAANLLLLTWPYRVWLDSICQRRRYEYVKEIVTAPPTAPPAPLVVHHHHHHTTTVVHAPSARAALSMQQQLY